MSRIQIIPEILERSVNTPIYLVEALDIDKVKEKISVLDNKQFRIFDIDISGITSRDKLFEAVAIAMRFPDYFGKNWNAFEECIRDFEWLPANGYLLLIKGIEDFQASCSADFNILMEVLIEAKEYWFEQKKPFQCILFADKSTIEFIYSVFEKTVIAFA
jgi:RNAse (barnase) inhibitor barstar